jgi:general secretion pathway protein B
MSYILDALRKADAQRVRDPARGIHAQPALDADGMRPPPSYRTGLWVTIGVGTVVLAATAWYLVQDKPPAVARHVPATGAVLMTNPAALPAVPAPPAPKVAVAALPPAPVAPVPIAPAPIPVAPAVQMPARPVPTQSLALQAPSPTGPGSMRSEGDPRNTSVPTVRGGPQAGPGMEPASAPPPRSSAPVPAPANPVLQQAPAAIARPAPVAPAPSTPAPLVTGLPPDAPKLAISGGVYSASASQRMLIVNGQVFSEGAEIGSGVVLEEIKPKSAVLKFRGTRYTVTY